MSGNIRTYIDASRELEVHRDVIAALTKAHGLTPKPVPRNGKAKGLDEADMRVLRKALGKPARARSLQAQAQ